MTFYTPFLLVFTIGIIMEFTSVPFLLTVTCISVGICASNPSQGRYMTKHSFRFLINKDIFDVK